MCSPGPTNRQVLMEHHLEPRGVLIFQIARHNCALLKARYDGLRSEENRVLLAQAREKRRRLYVSNLCYSMHEWVVYRVGVFCCTLKIVGAGARGGNVLFIPPSRRATALTQSSL